MDVACGGRSGPLVTEVRRRERRCDPEAALAPPDPGPDERDADRGGDDADDARLWTDRVPGSSVRGDSGGPVRSAAGVARSSNTQTPRVHPR
jgi:hypothetical protein